MIRDFFGRASILRWVTFLAVAFLALSSVRQSYGQQELSISSAGKHGLPAGNSGSSELSGLTWAGGDQYHSVSDRDHTVYGLSIDLNRSTGLPRSAVFDSPLVLDRGIDLEGIVFNSAAGSVYVSDETGPAIREHSLVDGSLLQTLPIHSVYFNIRPNSSLESLTLQSGHRSLWTVNEEALVGDGPLSGVGQGTVVRLQRYSDDLQLDGQWAYVTDGITADSPFITEEASGVSDLVALPDGRVLVLERELGGVGLFLLPEFRSRIYEVDFTNATNVTNINQLEGATYTPVGKNLLWEKTFLFNNYEGMALGRQLDDGSHSLLPVSDDGSGLSQSLFALRLYGAGPWFSQDPLIRGTNVTLTAENLDPGDHAFFLVSFTGAGNGPNVPQLGGLPLDLLSPITVLGDGVAGGTGVARSSGR